MDIIDTDDLPPTQYLILEVLAARHRTSETLWTFPSKLRPHMEALERLGLIQWKSGIVPKTVMAWLTEQGKSASTSSTYVSPNAEWTVRFRDGGVMSPNFTEGGARHRAQEMELEAVWRPVGPWQPAPPES
ncbi:hypothetical protein JNW90_09095 [Micromonospora sp. STR1s_5]|nr:hypothetical protein [Micromonospora sp. STR1s_5]